MALYKVIEKNLVALITVLKTQVFGMTNKS